MTDQLAGKVVVVTGAASGIGRAAAQLAAARGAAVACVDRNRAGAAETADSISASGGRALVFDVDVSNGPEVSHTVNVIATRFAGIDALVHAAGIQRFGNAVETSDEVWADTLAVNVTGAFHMCRATLPHIIERGGGTVIVVGSVQSVGAVSNSVAYITSKHAVLGLVRSIAVDFAREGVRAHCVCPGAIDTPMLRTAASVAADPAKVMETCERLHLFRRLGTPAEVARVCAFLLSEDASFMTGQPVFVDGGCMTSIGGTAFAESGTGSSV